MKASRLACVCAVRDSRHSRSASPRAVGVIQIEPATFSPSAGTGLTRQEVQCRLITKALVDPRVLSGAFARGERIWDCPRTCP